MQHGEFVAGGRWGLVLTRVLLLPWVDLIWCTYMVWGGSLISKRCHLDITLYAVSNLNVLFGMASYR